jgi:tetratricopeptide (TPR) repeat protein
MKQLLLTCAAILIPALAAHGQDATFPTELSHLNAFVSDEAQLVDAVRQFDILQQALIRWDEDLASEAARDGNQEEVERRVELIRERRELMEKAYKVLLAHYPKNARALNYYGEFLYDQRGEEAGAIQHWKLAIAEDSKLSLPHNNLGIFYTHSGDYQRGLAEYQKAAELEPDNADFKFNLAQMYLINWPQVKEILKWDDARVFKEAMKLSKEAAELRPADYELQQDYAVNFFAAERFGAKVDTKSAAAAWQEARKRATEMDEVFFTWLNEARVWMAVPDYERAIPCLKKALEIVPSSEVVQRLLAKAEQAVAENPPSS